MKIDKVFVLCNKTDFYFAKICISSIRYWNKEIPVLLIKDLSKGEFDTATLEHTLNVKLLDTKIKNLTYYAKLYPFIESITDERILIIDADIVWMCDIIALLEPFNEDIIIAGYNPENIKAEMRQWYFKEPEFLAHFPDYEYPGFLFNVGQIVCNTTVFTKADLTALVNWKEYPSPVFKNVFFYEQGILNYLVAKKIKDKAITYKLFNFQIWGWDKKIKNISTSDLQQKQSNPYLIHWYGVKNGLTSFLPGNNILAFYEQQYFSHFKNGKLLHTTERLRRSFKNLSALLYESAKSIYLLFKKNN